VTGADPFPGPFPGGVLTAGEVAEVARYLATAPVCFFLVVETSGDVVTFPPFVPSPAIPDLPTLLAYMSQQMMRTS